MIKTLNIVKGSVATKDLIPILTHFHIYDKRIQGNNGMLCVDAPLDSDLNVTVPADKFYKAVKMCGAKLKIKITDGGKLSMTCGKFRAFLNILANDKFPRLTISNEKLIEIRETIPPLKRLLPFVSDDASRAWSRSILVRNGYAYATNNIVIARTKVDFKWEGVIPVLAVKELIRIGKEPTHVIVEKNYVSFLYDDTVWIRATTCAQDWPNVESFINPCPAPILPNYFLDTLHALLPFCDDPKYPFFSLGEHGIRTDAMDVGADIDLAKFPESKFRAEPLISVANVANGIAFDNYPKPCYFVGEDIDGVLVGVL